MIIVHCKGGLGNQFFQYAAGRALAARHSVSLRFDARWYAEAAHQCAVHRSFDLPAFAVAGQLASDDELKPFALDYNQGRLARARARLTRAVHGRRVWRHEALGWTPAFERLGSEVLMEGYFQHPRYFASVEAELRSEFRLRVAPPSKIADLAARLAASDSVCIQVRRTDFVNNPETARTHGSCAMEYFAAAWREVRRRVPAARGYVFADEPEWAQEAFRAWPDVTVMGTEWNGPAFLHQFYLLQSCRHYIIANSTFGWWAAWLGRVPTSVVVMPHWWLRNVDVAATGLLLPGAIVCENG